jgi:hypothetical protein
MVSALCQPRDPSRISVVLIQFGQRAASCTPTAASFRAQPLLQPSSQPQAPAAETPPPTHPPTPAGIRAERAGHSCRLHPLQRAPLLVLQFLYCGQASVAAPRAARSPATARGRSPRPKKDAEKRSGGAIGYATGAYFYARWRMI